MRSTAPAGLKELPDGVHTEVADATDPAVPGPLVEWLASARLGLTDLTKAQAKEIDDRYLRAARGRPSGAYPTRPDTPPHDGCVAT